MEYTGTEAIGQMLRNLDLDKELKILKEEIPNTKNNLRELNNKILRHKILLNLKSLNVTPDLALMGQKLPVVPAVYRGLYELPTGSVGISPINLHLKNIELINQQLKEAQGKLPEENVHELEKELYEQIKTMSMIGKEKEGKVPSIFKEIAGDKSPKEGLFQSKVLKKRQDLSGRAVLTLAPHLNVDEVEMGYDMGLTMYKPFVVKRLKQLGLSLEDAKGAIDNKRDIAKRALQEEARRRPVMINRAPSIRNVSIIAMYPKFTEKQTLGINNFALPLLLGDIDGDQSSIHIPISNKAIEEAKTMLPSKNLIWEPTRGVLYRPSQEALIGLYDMSKTKGGLEKINKILPDGFDISDILDKPKLNKLIERMANSKNGNIPSVLNKLRQLGDKHATESGFTVSLSELEPAKKIREEIVGGIRQEIVGKDDKERRNIYRKYNKLVDEKLLEEMGKRTGGFRDMMISGAKGLPQQYRAMFVSPISFELSTGNVIPKPIEHAYNEGLTPAEYFMAQHGTREGVLGRYISTAKPGSLAKELMTTVKDQFITSIDGKYLNKISLPLDSSIDVVDRITAENIRDRNGKILIKRDTPLDETDISLLRKHKLKSVKVYTPLNSNNPDGGLPAMAYGNTKEGRLPSKGENVGISSAHSLVHPLFSQTLSSFHTGGELRTDIKSGYDRVKELLNLPKILENKSILSNVDGDVEEIEKDEIDNSIIKIHGIKHIVPVKKDVSVKVGDHIKKGDPLSYGPIDPVELADKKGLEAAQLYMVDELKKQIPSSRRVNLETIVNGLTNQIRIDDPGNSNYSFGDVMPYSMVRKLNEEGKNIKFQHIISGTNTLPQLKSMGKDWLSGFTYRNIKTQLQRAVEVGAESNIESWDPSVKYVLGER